jgi:chromosome segregation ATPase
MNHRYQTRKKNSNDFKALEKGCGKLHKQVEELHKHFEDETLTRIDLENNLQSIKEEIATYRKLIEIGEANMNTNHALLPIFESAAGGRKQQLLSINNKNSYIL